MCVRLSEQGMQIHISQTTKDHLEHEPYIIEERGKIFVKVRGYYCALLLLLILVLLFQQWFILLFQKYVKSISDENTYREKDT